MHFFEMNFVYPDEIRCWQVQQVVLEPKVRTDLLVTGSYVGGV